MNVFTGKTAEDAIAAGLKELGITREEAEIVVLEEGKRKLFGSVPAKVQIEKKEKKTDGERAVEFLEGLLGLIAAEATPVLIREEEKIEIELQAENTHGIIGRRGEIIDAMQVLAGAVANTGREEYKRVVVDCNHYREDREETLRRVAVKLAQKAVRHGKKVRLEPMNPYERRIIHSALLDSDEVTTKSEGKEPARFVVIIPKNLKTYEKRDRRPRDGRDGRGRDRGRGGKFEKKYGERKPYPKRDLPAEGTPETSGTSIRRDTTVPGYKKGGFNGFFGTFLGNSRDGASEGTEETAGAPQPQESETGDQE